ncbi:MAG: UdgX family uracil-DNA binding protein [Motilibacteraceae bacterium]
MSEAERIERPGAQQWVPDGADVEQLREAAPACRGCELWQGASQVVFSAGNPKAQVALVGEQPGDEEDRRGLPFVGPAGRLLQKAVDDAGIDRAQTYVTNSVKHFRFRQDGPGKRRIHQTPDLAHLEACKPWLAAELRAVDPELVICLGATAVRQLLGTKVKVMRDRGSLLERETSLGVRTFLVTVHPSSVLRSDDRDAAYAALVADLRIGADLLAGR